jgi:hypothetical protein
MSRVETAGGEFLNLEARGFGPLTGPDWSSKKDFHAVDSDKNFSYFSYKIDGQAPQLDAWSKLPTDLIWAFCRTDAYEQAGPCLLRLYERPIRSEANDTCKALVRHWCPILFDGDLLNK